MATTWYAQLSSHNIDAWAVTQSTVWNAAANGLGNWMQGANFAAGLGAGDILVANGKTGLAINVNVTCNVITTGSSFGGTDGGGFTVSSAITIAASIGAGATTSCVVMSGAGYTLTVNASQIVGGSGNACCGIVNPVAANLTVTGNVIGGSDPNALAYGILVTGDSSVVVIYGNVTGGLSSEGIWNQDNAPITVTGNVVAADASGITNLSTGILTINSGNLINTTTAQAVNGILSVYNPGTSNYIRCPQTSGTVDLALEQAANVRSGTPDGDVNGTMAVPLAAQVLYNVPVDNTVGTYVEAPAAQVSLGTHFGPSSSYTGTDLPASGPLVGAGGLVE